MGEVWREQVERICKVKVIQESWTNLDKLEFSIAEAIATGYEVKTFQVLEMGSDLEFCALMIKRIRTDVLEEGTVEPRALESLGKRKT
jgi:hypothetical protein